MDYLLSFLFGGFLCVIAQIFIDKTKVTPARILSAYVVAGVFLSAIGLYEPLVKLFDCGATVPLTGFGFSLAKGVEESINEFGFSGILRGGLTNTSAGIAAAVFVSIVCAVFFKGKPENL